MILVVPIPDRTLGEVLLGLRPGGLGLVGLRGSRALRSPLRGLGRLLGLLRGGAGLGHPGAS
jgi:hypothetical protein